MPRECEDLGQKYGFPSRWWFYRILLPKWVRRRALLREVFREGPRLQYRIRDAEKKWGQWTEPGGS